MLLRINTPHALDQRINVQYNDLSLLPKLNRLHSVSTGILLFLGAATGSPYIVFISTSGM